MTDHYDRWLKLIAERAPNKGDVAILTANEWKELKNIRGGGRPPKMMFGRTIKIDRKEKP